MERVCAYRGSDPSHFLEDIEVLIGDVLVELCHSFPNGFQSFGIVEGEHRGTVGADVNHLPVSQF